MVIWYNGVKMNEENEPPSNTEGISGTCKEASVNSNNTGDMVAQFAVPMVQRDICWSGRGRSWRIIVPMLYSDRVN